MSNELYAIRQYRPSFFSGFTNEALHNIAYIDILKASWLEGFKSNRFTEFTIKQYTDNELIIEAHYSDGEHWVAGFACREDNPFSKSWRYLAHESS